MSRFTQVSTEEMCRFVGRFPLAWITPAADPASASLMPLLFENSECVSMIGHLPKRIANCDAFKASRSVICLFLGPHSYIPPEWAGKDDWIPTWNFVSLKASGNIRFSDELTRPAVEFLVDHMQAESASLWSMARVEHRLPSILSRIVGFRIDVTKLTPRFKVGQDEDEDTYARLATHLSGHPLGAWMRR